MNSTDNDRLKRVQNELVSKYHHWIIDDEKHQEISIIDFLVSQFPNFDLSSWERRIEIGGVYVNRQRLTENIIIKPPCKIDYFEPKFDIYDLHKSFPVFKEEYILHEDDDIVIFFKPAKIPSIPSRDQNILSIRNILQQHTGTSIHMPSRLDNSAQGIMVISKSPRMHPLIQKLFEHKQVEKYYILQVVSHVEWQKKTVENCIGWSPLHRVLRSVTENGKKSITHFSLLRHTHYQENMSSFLQAQPITGRTHQIRLHAAHIGFPIIGDNFYDGIQNKDLHLLSYRIKFMHPFTNKTIDISVPDTLLPEWAKMLK